MPLLLRFQTSSRHEKIWKQHINRARELKDWEGHKRTNYDPHVIASEMFRIEHDGDLVITQSIFPLFREPKFYFQNCTENSKDNWYLHFRANSSN